MKIGLFANATRDPGGLYAREVCEFITARGHVAVEFGNGAADCLVVLGGDGTMLRAAHAVAGENIPLLGINLGNVGHLTSVGKENGLHAVNNVLEGNFTIQKRMMLQINSPVAQNSAVLHSGQQVALNDVVLRGERLTQFIVYVGPRPLTEFRADGVIVSTPTGSTAYNRSAGGPLLDPAADMLAITPICAAEPAVRPWVLAGDSPVSVEANRALSLFIDGEPLPHPVQGASVCRADCVTQIIITPPHPV